MTARTNIAGFTLLELLIVIAILGALASISILKLTGPTLQARDTRRETELKQYQTALEVYANNNSGRYPLANAGVNLITLCATLGVTACVDDPQASSNNLHYRYASDSYQYVLWAQLEKKGGPQYNQTQFFMICSSGEVAKRFPDTGTIAGGNCPL